MACVGLCLRCTLAQLPVMLHACENSCVPMTHHTKALLWIYGYGIYLSVKVGAKAVALLRHLYSLRTALLQQQWHIAAFKAGAYPSLLGQPCL